MTPSQRQTLTLPPRRVDDVRPAMVAAKVVKHCEDVDNLPRPMRELVHEFGYPIVMACMGAGLKKPGAIRQLVHEIWRGARSEIQRSKPINYLDWLLLQNSAGISAQTLVRLLAMSDLMIVPREPSTPMLEASMSTVSGHTVIVTKTEKHRRRLRAAVEAGAYSVNPFLRPGAT